VTALRSLYHELDGNDAPTPCDGIKPLTVAKVPPQIIAPQTINVVLANLERQAEAGRPHAAKDRARFMVLASTGKRPCEIMRAEPGDVDLRRRVWVARDAKGGFSPGAYLNDEMVLAWEAFILADAWGPYKTTHFCRRLRLAGWPKGVRPYNLRHSMWIEASERGTDLADIQAGAGHKQIATTRRHYVPVLNSRLQRLSQGLDGRLSWKR
jgi:integrase